VCSTGCSGSGRDGTEDRDGIEDRNEAASAGGVDYEASLERIVAAGEELYEIGEQAREFQAVVADDDTELVQMDLSRVFQRIQTGTQGSFELDVPSEPVAVLAHPKLPVALSAGVELLEGDGSGARGDVMDVLIRVRRDGETVTVAVTDRGGTIPRADLEAIAAEQETAVDHSRGMELWIVRWTVLASGGETSVAFDDPPTLTITLQAADGVRHRRRPARTAERESRPTTTERERRIVRTTERKHRTVWTIGRKRRIVQTTRRKRRTGRRDVPNRTTKPAAAVACTRWRAARERISPAGSPTTTAGRRSNCRRLPPTASGDTASPVVARYARRSGGTGVVSRRRVATTRLLLGGAVRRPSRPDDGREGVERRGSRLRSRRRPPPGCRPGDSLLHRDVGGV
jgi:hypothetical protein